MLIGPEEARDQSDKTGAGAEHQMVISVITDATGFLSIKTIAADISDALIGAPLTLSRGSLVSLFFLRATARRIRRGRDAADRPDLPGAGSTLTSPRHLPYGERTWLCKAARIC